MADKLAIVIIQTAREALNLWKTFVETREISYRRSMDKRSRKAIDYGEKMAMSIKEYFTMVSEVENGKTLQKKEKEIEKYITYFFKYNQ